MVMLREQDIETKEVLGWQGLHLLHFSGSSCSQKLRIMLAIKKVPWESHEIDLTKNENYGEWFMGINPRGLVPVLVDDGQVIIESNDILQYLEDKFASPKLILDEHDTQATELLAAEDALHLDLRSLTMRFCFPAFIVKRSEDKLEDYNKLGSGTVEGQPDPHKAVELKFFTDMNTNNGITDQQVVISVNKFKQAFEALESRLTVHKYLLSDNITVIDIAWYIYATRLITAGYPLHRLHNSVGAWFDKLNALGYFRKEVAAPLPIKIITGVLQLVQKFRGTTLVKVAGL